MDNSRKTAYKVIHRFINIYSNIDHILSYYLSRNEFTLKEKNFIKELVYGIIRNKRLLLFAVNYYSDKKSNQTDKKLISIFLLGSYQILFMNSVPSYAAIFSTVELAKLYTRNKHSYVNAILRRIDENKIPQMKFDFANKLSIKYSYPKFLIDRWIKSYGNNISQKICEINSLKPDIWIRINTRNSTINQIITNLSNLKIEFTQINELPEYLKINKICDKVIDLLNNGSIYVQNPSSAYIVKLLDIQDNDVILDACSAPGGKLSYIWNLSNSSNVIHAIESNKNRAMLLKENISRMSNSDIKVHIDDSTTYSSSIMYDKVIIDAPCSSTGTIRKNPDVKWIVSKDEIKKNTLLQTRLLNNISKIIKLNGKIIYSTCSIEFDENENIIEDFLIENKSFILEPVKNIVSEHIVENSGFLKILPNKKGFEGMFAACLKRIK